MAAGEGEKASTGAVRRTSIRLRILFLLCLLAVPLSAERVISLLADRRVQVTAAEDSLRDLALRAALAQQEGFAAARALLDVVSRQARALVRDPAACNRFLESLVSEVSGIQSLAIAAPSGVVICAHAPVAVGVRFNDRAQLAAALSSRDIVMSGLTLSQLTGRGTVNMLRADHNGSGHPQSVTVLGIDLQWLSRIAAHTATRAGVVVDLVGPGGAVLTRYPHDPDIVEQRFPDHPLTKALLSADQGTVATIGYDGKERIFAFLRFEGTDMHVAVGTDSARIVAPIDNRILTTALAHFLALICFLLVAWFAAERLLLSPIARLTQAVTAVGREETDRVEDVGVREFVPLVSAFDDMARRLSERNKALRSINGHLSALAHTDGLTELANRRTFDVQFSQDWVRARGDGIPLTIVLADVDNFKLFNDKRGHLAGDEALRSVARMLTAAAAGSGYLVARYGGEEFIVLMPNADRAQGLAFAQDARHLIATLAIDHPGVPGRRLSASFGIASMVPTAESNPDTLVARADAALYEAKRLGRDRVVAAPDEAEQAPP